MGVVQIQTKQYKHKLADSKQTYKHMKAQTSRQQADIQTHDSTNKKNHCRYKNAYGHTRHRKTRQTQEDNNRHKNA